ncbi:hypothetical protein [Prevotella dentasini]|uniref:hypothetical protein n=1 Tax=Prevotella dentasini TaxID=589537 RepID=UPI00046A0679|nr:hypothetical protein [Prevotella dentasini]
MNSEQELYSQYGKERAFNVPDGYFDSFSIRLMTRIKDNGTAGRQHSSHIVIRFLRPLAIAASFLVVVLVAGLMLSRQENRRTSSEQGSVSSAVSVSSFAENNSRDVLDEAIDYMALDDDEFYVAVIDEQ